jgi:hypothetical protein
MFSKLELRFLRAALVTGLVCLLPLFARAQSERPVTINVGGGFSPLVGDVGNYLNNGWHVTGGVGYNMHNGVFSIGPQFTYDAFGVSPLALKRAGTPGGDSHLWSITAEPRLQLPFAYKFRPYIVGGVGYYRRAVNFTQPALTTVTFFDPFFGYVYPGVVGVNQVLKRETHSGIGGNLGAGFAVKLGHAGTEFFTEARYVYAATGNVPTRVVPVTFGFRF